MPEWWTGILKALLPAPEGVSSFLKMLLPGAIGAALAAWFLRKEGPAHVVLSFLVGFAFASYALEPVLHYFALRVEVYGGGVGFVLGFSGMSLCSKLLTLIHEADVRTITGRGPR